MKKLILLSALLFAPIAVADEDAGAVDAGGADAGASVVVVGETVKRPVVTSADGGTAFGELEKVDAESVVTTLKGNHPKNWKVLFAVCSVIALLVTVLRQFGGKVIPFLKTDRGGALLVLVLGLSGGVVNGLVAGDGMSLDGVLTGTMWSFMSAGGFTIAKKLLFPADAKAPAKS